MKFKEILKMIEPYQIQKWQQEYTMKNCLKFVGNMYCIIDAIELLCRAGMTGRYYYVDKAAEKLEKIKGNMLHSARFEKGNDT